jgi:hypothetical protein
VQEHDQRTASGSHPYRDCGPLTLGVHAGSVAAAPLLNQAAVGGTQPLRC